ncbi:MAG: threonine/serine dehydratase [Woeseia sp.]|nr:threonine/serine dehydratase [Woeseia sp.]NNE59523.1 threonine/serine dehydratase [Woeseia sp.]NNL54368.1 threonine/serine dehydratase [Woeseia sp.]
MNLDRLPADAVLAANRISPYIRQTPLEHSPYFSEQTGANVWLKLENLQLTGSFKLRGAFNKLLSLTADQRGQGAVAASSGNHGAAVAWAMAQLKVAGMIFVPEQTSSVKVEAIRRAGVTVEFFGHDGLDTELHAREYAHAKGMHYLSPYNDAAVIAGQGSCGVEIARQLNKVDALVVAVGGGGLVSGAGAFLRSAYPNLQIIACQPVASAVMAESIQNGKILDLPSAPTLSDGTAGGIEPGAITFELCQQLVSQFVLISEEQIAAAMRDFIDAHHMLLEGAAGVALAGLRKKATELRGKSVVVIVCGANISRESLKKIL